MSLLGLLLCGLGMGYAVHKDNQKFANMNREATRLYGRGINESVDDMAMSNKYFREIKKYFEDKYTYYLSDNEYMEKCVNAVEMKRDDVTRDELKQFLASSLAYSDMIDKYAPDYKRYKSEFANPGTIYKALSFYYIARALARKELYRLGFCPSHMENMNCTISGLKLYEFDGCGSYGRLGPSEYDNFKWSEQPFKYHYLSPIDNLGEYLLEILQKKNLIKKG